MKQMEQEPQTTAEDVAGVYRLFLRRDPETARTVSQNVGRPLAELLRACLGSEEFDHNTVAPVLGAGAIDAVLKAPALEAVEWAHARLPLDPAGRRQVRSASTWLALYKALFEDQTFAEAIGEGSALNSADGRKALDVASHLQGEVYGSDGRFVSGWARWTDERGPVSLECWSEGKLVGQALATSFDRGLEQRFPGGGACAFRIALPQTAADRAFSAQVREASTGRPIGDVEVQPLLDRGALTDFSERLDALSEGLAALQNALPGVWDRAATPLERYDAHYRQWLATPFAAPPYSGRSVAALLDGLRASPIEIEAAARSILAQSHPRLALYIIVSDGDRPLFDDAARRMGQAEGVRVEVATPETLGGLQDLDADYVHLMDGRAVAHPDLLAAAAQFLDESPSFDALYFDEDEQETKDGEAGERRVSPRFKPDFDIDLLLQQPFVGASLTMRRDAWAAIAGALEFGGVSPSAAALTLEAQGRLIGHEALMLQSRQPGASVSLAEDWKRIVARHLETQGSLARPVEEADVLAAPSDHRHRVVWPLPSEVRASVVIPTRDRLDLLRPCLESLFEREQHNRTRMEIIVVDHQSEEPATRAYLDDVTASRPDVRVLPFEGAFNWALMNNLAASQATSDVLVFLNNDTVAISPDWLDELTAQALRPEVGVVGARLIYADGSLQHGGFVAADHRENFLGHEGLGVPGSDGGYLGRHAVVRQTTAVTGACMAVAADKFAALGGFEAAAFPVDGNDVDLCFRARAQGLRVLYTPFSTFYHLESKTRGFGADEAHRQAARAAVARLWVRWGETIGQDPFYNRNFDRLSEPFTRLRPPAPL